MASTLQERFRAVAKRIRADFEESGHTKHHGSRGTEREEIVAKFLDLYVPGTVEVVHNAEIVSIDGEVSKQCDIVIVDRSVPRLRDIRSHRIIPVECVYGVIEVKTRLNGPELADACAKIATIRRLPRKSYTQGGWTPLPIFGHVFAFNSIRMKTLSERLLKWCADNPRDVHPDGVWVVDSGMLVWGPVQGPPDRRPAIWHPAIHDPRLERELLLLEGTEEGDVLLGMIIAISQLLARPLPPFDLVSYLANGLVYRLSDRSSLPNSAQA
jgi:hypothetical protein